MSDATSESILVGSSSRCVVRPALTSSAKHAICRKHTHDTPSPQHTIRKQKIQGKRKTTLKSNYIFLFNMAKSKETVHNNKKNKTNFGNTYTKVYHIFSENKP